MGATRSIFLQTIRNEPNHHDMQLGILLAVLASIMISENAPAEPVSEVPLRLVLIFATSLSVVLLATWGSFTLSRVIRVGTSDRKWLHWFARLERWHLICWLATVAVVVYLLHWPQVVRYNWGLDRAVVIRDLLILAPVWIPLLFSWAAFYEVERARSRSIDGWEKMDRSPDGRTGRVQFVWLRARHYLGLCLLPILVLLAFQDLVLWWKPSWKESEFGWLLYLVPIVGVTLAFPQLLSRIWQTSPLAEGPLRDRLQTLTRRIKVHARDIRVWRTNGQLLNAAVTGLLPSLRYIFITDGLLALLRDSEVEAVIAHELGHVRRRHLLMRMLLLALPIWIMGNVQAFAPAVSEQCALWMGQWFGSQAVVNSIVIPALTVAYAVIALGRYSRLLEHDADLQVHDAGHAEVFCTTLDRLSYLSNDNRHRHSWLHPSTAARVHLLQLSIRDAGVAQAFRRRVNRLNATVIAIWIGTPILLALSHL